ncbi:MAG: hypothetical protein EHM28_13115, partial [Spirochaetaceae bacterium]
MKIQNIVVSLVCIFLVYVSCTTMDLPAPKSDNDAILLFFTESRFIMSDTLYFHGLEIGIKGLDWPVLVDPTRKLTAVSNLSLGNHITESIKIVGLQNSNWVIRDVGDRSEFTIPFRLESRKLTIFPLKFIYTVQRSGDSARDWWGQEPISPDDVKKITE